MLTESELQRKSVQYRKALLQLIKTAKAGHTGGDLSCLAMIATAWSGRISATANL
jgi:transketolase